MRFFQNFAPQLSEKECESRHELHPPSRGYSAAGGSHGFVIPSSFVIFQTISPGDPAVAGPLDSPQSKLWMATGMVPPDNN
jgi:hypothetical protein